MGTFTSFIESEAFFPVLIVLLVALVGVFIWIIVSNSKEAKKELDGKKNIVIDESAELKIIPDPSKQNANLGEVKELSVIEEEPSDEIKIIEEFSIKPKVVQEEVVIEPVIEPIESNEEEVSIYEENPTREIQIIRNEPEVMEEELIEVVPNTSVGSDVPIMMVEEDTNVQESIDNYVSNLVQPVELDGLQTEPVNELFDIQMNKTIEEEYEEDSTLNDNVEINAFNTIPNEDVSINENISIETPTEYTNEKTEVFDFDFTALEQTKEDEEEIEKQIIDAANSYISSIMNR